MERDSQCRGPSTSYPDVWKSCSDDGNFYHRCFPCTTTEQRTSQLHGKWDTARFRTQRTVNIWPGYFEIIYITSYHTNIGHLSLGLRPPNNIPTPPIPLSHMAFRGGGSFTHKRVHYQDRNPRGITRSFACTSIHHFCSLCRIYTVLPNHKQYMPIDQESNQFPSSHSRKWAHRFLSLSHQIFLLA